MYVEIKIKSKTKKKKKWKKKKNCEEKTESILNIETQTKLSQQAENPFQLEEYVNSGIGLNKNTLLVPLKMKN